MIFLKYRSNHVITIFIKKELSIIPGRSLLFSQDISKTKPLQRSNTVTKSAYYRFNFPLKFYSAFATSAIKKYCVIWFNSAFCKLNTTRTHPRARAHTHTHFLFERWWEVFTKISWNSILGKIMTLQERSPFSPGHRRPTLMWPRPPLTWTSGPAAGSFCHEASASTALCIYMYLISVQKNPLSSCPSN